MYFEWLLSCWDSIQSASREPFMHAKNLLPGGVAQLKMGLGDRNWDSAAWLCKVSRDGTCMSENPNMRHVCIVTQRSKVLRRETYSLHLSQTIEGFLYVPQGTFCLLQNTSLQVCSHPQSTLCFYVCVWYISVQRFMLCKCMARPQADIKGLLHSLPTIFSKTASLVEPKTHWCG